MGEESQTEAATSLVAAELRWLIRIVVAVVGLSVGPGLVGAPAGQVTHAWTDPHPVMVERVAALKQQLDAIERKVDALARKG